MRVLFLSPVPDFKGGAERSLFDLLRNPGIVPMLAVPAAGPVGDAAAKEGFPVEIVDYGLVTTIRRPLRPAPVAQAIRDWIGASRRLRAVARRHKVDVIHSNGLKAHCIAGLARMTGGPPVVMHIRDIAVRRSEEMVWRTLARVATRMVVVSRACWPGATLPENVKVVPNGIVPPIAHPAPPNPDGSAITIGICGRIHPFKGLDTLVEWLAAARIAGLPATLVVRGEAFEDDWPYLAQVQAQIAALGLGDHVRFDGRVEGLEAVYEGLDAVAVPSTTPDPLPRSVMEAMALGLPVIGYPAGGIPDMIDHGRTGWLVADAKGFVDALQTIAQGGPQVAEIGAAARAKIAKRFTLPAMYARLNGIYRQIAPNG